MSSRAIIDEEGVSLLEKIGRKLIELFDLEHSVPIYTANNAIFDQERSAWLSTIYNYNQPNYSDEHKVMADVHAYFKVASTVSYPLFLHLNVELSYPLPCPTFQRFIDHVVLCLEGEWHKKFVQRLEETLIEKIPTLSEDRLACMFREHASIRTKRETFTRNIDQLSKIKMRLLEYEREASTGLDY